MTPVDREQSPEPEPEHTDDRSREAWLGKRVWDGILRWEKENLELVLENKQSVARDHLGTPHK
jgi:hypothetical protein